MFFPPAWNLIYCNEPDISLKKIYVLVAGAVCAWEGGFPKSLENIPEEYRACSRDHMRGTLPWSLSAAAQIGVKGSLHGEWQPFLVSDPDSNRRLIGKSLNTHIWILPPSQTEKFAGAERSTAAALYTQGAVSQELKGPRGNSYPHQSPRKITLILQLRKRQNHWKLIKCLKMVIVLQILRSEQRESTWKGEGVFSI